MKCPHCETVLYFEVDALLAIEITPRNRIGRPLYVNTLDDRRVVCEGCGRTSEDDLKLRLIKGNLKGEIRHQKATII